MVHLDFPFHGGMDLSASIVFWKPIVPNESGDIAVLRPTSSLPADLNIAPLLLEIPLPNRHFEVYGFPIGNDTGAWARGELGYRRPDGSIQIEDTKETGYRIQPGFSGAPVWDVQGHGVVGMVVEAELDPMAKAAYIIPSALLIKAWSVLNQQSTAKDEREQVIVQLPSIRTRTDSAYSWPLQPNFAHPYPLQEHFTGRIRERKMLTEWLISRKHSLLALVAIGGMGKSSLT